MFRVFSRLVEQLFAPGNVGRLCEVCLASSRATLRSQGGSPGPAGFIPEDQLRLFIFAAAMLTGAIAGAMGATR